MKRSSLLPFLRFAALIACIHSASTLQASASREVIVDQAVLSSLPSQEQARVLDLQCRLETLLATDRSTLGREERRALRTDYRAMKQEMNAFNREGTVIYLSSAAIIIIVLLLILIL